MPSRKTQPHYHHHRLDPQPLSPSTQTAPPNACLTHRLLLVSLGVHQQVADGHLQLGLRLELADQRRLRRPERLLVREVQRLRLGLELGGWG